MESVRTPGPEREKRLVPGVVVNMCKKLALRLTIFDECHNITFFE